MVTITRYTDVVAVLSDPRFQVAPVPPAGPDTDTAWLRATVSRFSTGPVHTRRRGLVEHELAGLDPGALRARAAAHPMDNPEVVPVEVLSLALGASAPVSDPVSTIAARYHPGTGDSPEADSAVRDLVAAFGGVPDERTAARIAVLVQAWTTGTLIRHALRAVTAGAPVADVPALLTEVLRHDPPVPVMRRLCIAPARGIPCGTPVVLDVAAANRDPAVFTDPDRFDPGRPDLHLTFGAGLRPCPGRDHAFALATGVLEAFLKTR